MFVEVSSFTPSQLLLCRRERIGDFLTPIDGGNDHEKSAAGDYKAQWSRRLVSFFIYSKMSAPPLP